MVEKVIAPVKVKKILFVTTASLSTNPRLLKEVSTASAHYEVDIIAFRLGNWSDETDRSLVKSRKLNVSYISATRRPYAPWFISTLLSKLFRFFPKTTVSQDFVASIASNKRSLLLFWKLHTIRKKYDLVVGHNLGSLYPVFNFAQKNSLPFVFDMEDYHPGEFITDGDELNEVKRRELICKKYLPLAATVTYASPLIREQTLKLIQPRFQQQHLLINNSFPADEFTLPDPAERTATEVSFVWFSQNITTGRGIELFIEALAAVKGVQLTLIGQMSKEFKDRVQPDHYPWINVIPPLSQHELHQKLSTFDVGIACDLSSADLNRELALTNKIFAYYQAGLFVLATDTRAQQQFLQEHNQAGKLVKQEVKDIRSNIGWIVENIDPIRLTKRLRYEKAKSIAWEMEKVKLLKLWEALL